MKARSVGRHGPSFARDERARCAQEYVVLGDVAAAAARWGATTPRASEHERIICALTYSELQGPMRRIAGERRVQCRSRIKNSTCGGCVSHVTRALSEVPGVRDVEVSLPNHTATVELDDVKASLDAMRTVVRAAGYDIVDAPVKAAAGGRCG